MSDMPGNGKPPGARGQGGDGQGGTGGRRADRRRRRPNPQRGRPGGGSPQRPAPVRSGPIRVKRLPGGDFELVHPSCVVEAELDYEEGMEIWKAGDPEGARDALRYALGACRDNIWIHAALGRIALEEFRDPSLARGHFGYAVELVKRGLPPRLDGRLPPDRPNNRPFFEAADGLIRSLEALGLHEDAASLRDWRDGLKGRV